jgi:hypothetical protein
MMIENHQSNSNEKVYISNKTSINCLFSVKDQNQAHGFYNVNYDIYMHLPNVLMNQSHENIKNKKTFSHRKNCDVNFLFYRTLLHISVSN